MHVANTIQFNLISKNTQSIIKHKKHHAYFSKTHLLTNPVPISFPSTNLVHSREYQILAFLYILK